jgi:hypothetical protein
MRYVSVPKVPRIPRISNIRKAMEVKDLLNRNGYEMTCFTDKGIGFYKTEELSDSFKGYVPFDAWIMMTKKEFLWFLDLLQDVEEMNGWGLSRKK